jgi:DNA-damage-inducible protein J
MAKGRKTATVRARVDRSLKVEAEAILEGLGLTPSTVGRLLYRQVVLYGGLPFELRIPNAETAAAMREVEQGIGLVRHDTVDELFANREG